MTSQSSQIPSPGDAAALQPPPPSSRWSLWLFGISSYFRGCPQRLPSATTAPTPQPLSSAVTSAAQTPRILDLTADVTPSNSEMCADTLGDVDSRPPSETQTPVLGSMKAAARSAASDFDRVILQHKNPSRSVEGPLNSVSTAATASTASSVGAHSMGLFTADAFSASSYVGSAAAAAGIPSLDIAFETQRQQQRGTTFPYRSPRPLQETSNLFNDSAYCTELPGPQALYVRNNSLFTNCDIVERRDRLPALVLPPLPKGMVKQFHGEKSAVQVVDNGSSSPLSNMRD